MPVALVGLFLAIECRQDNRAISPLAEYRIKRVPARSCSPIGVARDSVRTRLGLN